MKNNRSPLDVCINFNNIHLQQTIKPDQMVLSTPTCSQPKYTKLSSTNEKGQRKKSLCNKRKQNYEHIETKGLFSNSKSCQKHKSHLQRVHSTSSFQKKYQGIQDQCSFQYQLNAKKNRSLSKFQEQTVKISVKDIQSSQRLNSIFYNIRSILFQRTKKCQDWESFNYQQMLLYLYKCGYIKYQCEKYYQNQEQKEELKNVYTLWISLSNSNSRCLISNLIILTIIYENLMKQIDFRYITQKMSQIVANVTIQSNFRQTTEKKRCILSENSFTKYSPQQSYHMQPINIYKPRQQPINLFFVKKKTLEFEENGILKLIQKDKLYLQKIYKRFIGNLAKYNKIAQQPIEDWIQNQKHQGLTKKRCNSVQQNNGESNFVDRLSQKAKVRTEKLQDRSKIQITKKALCSNQNKTVSISIQTRKANKPAKTTQQTKIITELSRPKSIPKQKSSDQIQFEKDSKQFTFHPKTNNHIRMDKEPLIKKIKNADQVIYRMQQARDQKLKRDQLLKSGWTNQEKNLKNAANGKTKIILSKSSNQNMTQKIDKEQTSKTSFQKILKEQPKDQETISHQQQDEVEKQPEGQIKSAVQQIITSLQTKNNFMHIQSSDKLINNSCANTPSSQQLRIPILYIDVNIQDGKKERIIIYEGDKAEELSYQFGKRHKLDKNTIQRLQAMLEQQIRSVLTRIDQETQQDSSIVY